MNFFECFKTNRKLDKLLEGQEIMATTLDQLDSALTSLTTLVTGISAAITQLVSDYNGLVTKAANGVDVTSELATVNNTAAALQADLTAIQGADSATIPPPAPTPGV